MSILNVDTDGITKVAEDRLTHYYGQFDSVAKSIYDEVAHRGGIKRLYRFAGWVSFHKDGTEHNRSFRFQMNVSMTSPNQIRDLLIEKIQGIYTEFRDDITSTIRFNDITESGTQNNVIFE